MACDRYTPVPEWTWPNGWWGNHFEDIPSAVRYTDCECGGTWLEHHPGTG